MFSLRLLGGLTFTGPSGAVTGPAAQPARLAPLARLAVSDGRVSRDELVHLLWPDREEGRGRRNLSDALYVLRQELGDEAIVASGDAVRLDPGVVTTDVAAFEQALERGAAREAVALYGGPFLDGVHLRDTVPFERWVDEQRDRLAGAYGEALESLAAAAEEVGDAREAVRWRSELAAERPYSTTAVLGLMRALERAGEPAAALEAGHLHAERLRQELKAEPDPRLEAELERIRTAPESGEARLPAVGSAEAPAPAEPDEGPSAEEESAGADGPLFAPSANGVAVAFGFVLTLLLGFVFVLSDRTAPPATAGVKPDRVAVFPFRVGGASPALSYLEEGMVDLLAARLSGEGGPRAIDPRTALAAWRRHGDGRSPVSSDRVRKIAARLGAGSSVVGEVVGTEQHLTATARLLPGDPSAEKIAAEVSGPADSLPAMVDRLAARLLIGTTAAATPLLQSLTTESLPALRAYLAGRAAWRRGRESASIRHYEEALDRDSTFAMAAMGLAEAASRLPGGISMRHPLVRRGLRLARGHRDRLSVEEQRYLEALSKPRYPETMFPMDEVVALWTDVAHDLRDRPEAWYRLGQHLAEFGPQLGLEDSQELAASRLSQAVRLDSTFLPALRQLVWLASHEGDRARLARLARLYLERDPSGAASDYTRWRIALARSDEETLAQLRARFADMSDASLVLIVGFGQIDGVELGDVRRAGEILWRRARNRRMMREPYGRGTAIYLLKSYAVNGGRPARADSLLRMRWEGRTSFRRYHYDRIYAALYEDGDTTGVRSSVRRLARGDVTGGFELVETDVDAGRRALDLCMVQQWRLWHGDTLGAADASRRVREDEPLEGAPCATVLDILLAAERGGEAAEAARGVAEAYLDDAWMWPTGFMIEFAAARLFQRLGDPAAAVEALEQRPYRAVQGSWTLGHALHEIGRLSLAAGDTAGAIEAYGHWLALHDRPEASRREEVERVRALVDRLASYGPPPPATRAPSARSARR